MKKSSSLIKLAFLLLVIAGCHGSRATKQPESGNTAPDTTRGRAIIHHTPDDAGLDSVKLEKTKRK